MIKRIITFKLSSCLEWRGADQGGERQKEIWGLMDNVIILIVVMVLWGYTCLKTYQAVHFKYEHMNLWYTNYL